MPGVGFLLGGMIVALGSPRTAFAVAGVGILVLVLAAAVIRPGTDAIRPRRRPARPWDAA